MTWAVTCFQKPVDAGDCRTCDLIDAGWSIGIRGAAALVVRADATRQRLYGTTVRGRKKTCAYYWNFCGAGTVFELTP